IHHHIVDAALGHPHQLALRVLHLKMQTAQGPLLRVTMVVLHEARVDASAREFLNLPGFHEKPASIAEYLRLDELHILQRRVDEFHSSVSFTMRRKYSPYPPLANGSASFKTCSVSMNPARQAISSSHALFTP